MSKVRNRTTNWWLLEGLVTKEKRRGTYIMRKIMDESTLGRTDGLLYKDRENYRNKVVYLPFSFLEYRRV